MSEEELSQMDKEELLGVIKAQQYEVERLNVRVKQCEEAYLRTRHQYSELEGKYVVNDHIINELEKWLDAEIKRINDIKEGKGSKVKPYGEEKNNYQIMISGYKYCLDKLQELKGDSSN